MDHIRQDNLLNADVTGEPGERGPSRKVYRPTPEGYAACGTATLRALSTPTAGSRPFFLGLNNIVGLPHDEAVEAVRTYRDGLHAKHAEVRAARVAEIVR